MINTVAFFTSSTIASNFCSWVFASGIPSPCLGHGFAKAEQITAPAAGAQVGTAHLRDRRLLGCIIPAKSGARQWHVRVIARGEGS